MVLNFSAIMKVAVASIATDWLHELEYAAIKRLNFRNISVGECLALSWQWAS